MFHSTAFGPEAMMKAVIAMLMQESPEIVDQHLVEIIDGATRAHEDHHASLRKDKDRQTRLLRRHPALRHSRGLDIDVTTTMLDELKKMAQAQDRSKVEESDLCNLVLEKMGGEARYSCGELPDFCVHTPLSLCNREGVFGVYYQTTSCFHGLMTDEDPLELVAS